MSVNCRRYDCVHYNGIACQKAYDNEIELDDNGCCESYEYGDYYSKDN